MHFASKGSSFGDVIEVGSNGIRVVANTTVSVPGLGGGWSINGNYSNQKIMNDYQSTGQFSGLYAGNDGVQVDVNDTTYLKGGVISDTGRDSHLNTGKLIAKSQENHSKWNVTSTGGGFSLGIDALGGTLGPLGVVAGNLAANSDLISSGNRKYDETNTSQSAISGNVTVNAGSTWGRHTTDVNSADGHLDNNFNANKLANQLQNSQLGMQLVGEIMRQISDALNSDGVLGFDETKLSNDWGCIILEATGSAAIKGAFGGNVGSAAASLAVGTATAVATVHFFADNALSLAKGDKDLAILLTNIGMDIAASGTGVAAEAAMSGILVL
ncbi:hypothetical protein [Commensalibacter oyaizuii]|uniref:Uncharacterized protein n=1 Tax=Commensalibacter oyaizuii TaxID=3043873 RepID=A0ABT6Q2F6_9PROT|nr:hypothetical protein [Commensalibacter sp. TBRC 16381]MDI2091290.1 hypothetical protein [Commensalibacter sp. TBRC 16381]